MNTGDVLIQFHHSVENDRKLYYTEKFSIKRILNTFEHSVAYENKRVSDARAESLLIGIYLKYFRGEKKQETETTLGFESPTPVDTFHSPWIILPP